ncbi:hypothetical protein GCM10010285_53630 [Streptomyces pseudogriseolus]|uniref:Transposase n=1 Tax=Streptomyces pseudogriseolus TaxID=36817 RepID=A0ABQ2THQ4_STREZ|nr:hypothetical protein GCM10010285_53630 [Streptomyces rubiginosus]
MRPDGLRADAPGSGLIRIDGVAAQTGSTPLRAAKTTQSPRKGKEIGKGKHKDQVGAFTDPWLKGQEK